MNVEALRLAHDLLGRARNALGRAEPGPASVDKYAIELIREDLRQLRQRIDRLTQEGRP